MISTSYNASNSPGVIDIPIRHSPGVLDASSSN